MTSGQATRRDDVPRVPGLPFVIGAVAGRLLRAAAGAAMVAAATLASAAAPLQPFVENEGQYPAEFRYVARDNRAWVGVGTDGIRYLLGTGGERLTEQFIGGRRFEPKAGAQSVTRVNLLRGADASQWRRNLPSFRSVELGEVFPGIAVELQHGARGVEKVFRVRPGASVDAIAVGYAQPHSLTIAEDGALLVALSEAESVRFSPPIAFQDIDGQREHVDVRYRLRDDGVYGFAVGAYRRDLPLVIDPTLLASTLLGGDGYDQANKVLVDKTGKVVVGGHTTVPYSGGTGFPSVGGGYQTAMKGSAGRYEIFVARFDTELKQMLSMTFLGSWADDYLNAMKMAPDGSFWIAGYTGADADFPTSASAYQKSGPRGGGGYVSHLSADLSTLIASTVFDFAPYTANDFYALALDSAGNVFIGGIVDGGGLPDRGGFQPVSKGWTEAMVLKFNNNLSQLLGATHLGGSSWDKATGIAVDSTNRVYVVGHTSPKEYPPAFALNYDFPSTGGTFMPAGTGCNASFLVRLSNDLKQLQAGTFIGVPGSSATQCGYSTSYGDVQAHDLVISPDGKIYVAGQVESAGLPVTGGVQPVFMSANNSHHWSAFALRFDANLAKVEAATYLGGTNWSDTAQAIALNSKGEVVLGGRAGATDFPTTIDAYESRLNQGVYGYNTYDAFAAVLSKDLNRYVWGTVIGGTRQETMYGLGVGPDDSIYLVGLTQGVWDPAQNFPTTAGAFDSTLVDWGLDAFIARLQVPKALTTLIKGPARMLPGTEADFEVHYRSSLDAAVSDAVVLVDLLPGMEFAGGSAGATYFSNGACVNQLFWKLGTIAPGTDGVVRFTMRVPAGAPDGEYKVTARISGANAPEKPFDVAPYLAHTELKVDSTAYLSASEAAAARAGDAALQALYDYAMANGYGFTGVATRTTYSDSQQMLRYFLVSTSDGARAVLSASAGRAFVEVFRGNLYTLFDQTGSLTWNRADGTVEFGGGWADAAAAPIPGAASMASLSKLRMGRCNFNCMINLIPEMTLGKVNQIFSMLTFAVDCTKCAQTIKNGQTDETNLLTNCGGCGAAAAEAFDAQKVIRKVPGIGDVATIALRLKDCIGQCAANPDQHVCTQDRYDCSCFGNWVFGGVCKTDCNKTTGTYAPVSKTLYCTADKVCNAASCNSSGYESCCVKEADLCPKSPGCNTKTVTAAAARDPNAKLADKEGAALAGTRVYYTLQYENVGTGDALGVFVLDVLSPHYDAATLAIGGGGSYDAATRLLQWNIGTLGPKQKGEVTFNVKLRSDLAVGTEVTNQAEVYFPSALEITPTNFIKHVIGTVAAHGKTVNAVSGVAAAVTLSGEGPGAVAYELLSQPIYGTLTGTAPNLTYTSAANFVGADHFSYRISSGGQTSSPAKVALNVAVNPADATAPTVLSVSPASGATAVVITGGAIADGSWLPVIQATFSEPIDPATVTTANFGVNGVGGKVAYDASTRTASFWPNGPLSPNYTYTARAGTGIKDLKGNAMAATHQWNFTTGKQNQTITFNALADRVLGTAPFSVSASASSGLAVSFSSLTSGVCTMSGSTVTLKNAGTCTVAANQAGNANWNPAPETTQSFTVSFASGGSLTVAPASLDFDGQSMKTTSPALPVTVTNTGATPVLITQATATGNFAATTSCGTLAAGASCAAQATFTPQSEGTLNGTMTVVSAVGAYNVSLTGIGERSLVTHYFRSILRRAPDASGKAYWNSEAARVQALGADLNEVWYAMTMGFFNSTEYLAFNRNNGEFITDLYRTFLNREPDTGGRDYWLWLISQGLTREVILVDFMFSPEFRSFTASIFGDTSVRRELDAVMDFYRGLLSRLPDGGGFAYWVNRFRVAQCAGAAAVTAEAEAISSGFATGPEYAARNRTNSQYVGDLYNAILRRGGEPQGVLYWIDLLNRNVFTREQVRQQFVASPEFQGRVQQIIAAGCLNPALPAAMPNSETVAEAPAGTAALPAADASTAIDTTAAGGVAQASAPQRLLLGVAVEGYRPEGMLDAAAALTQRSRIATAQDRAADLVVRLGGTVQTRYGSLPYLAATVPAAAVGELRSSPLLASVSSDRLRQPTLVRSAALVGADLLWRQGLTGLGWTVALPDTGIDAAHPFLAGKVIGEACDSSAFSGNATQPATTSLCPGGRTSSAAAGSAQACDRDLADCAHGTHVAGIVAGRHGPEGLTGIAPEASLLALQIYSRLADGSGIGAWDSDLIKALERVHAASGQHRIAAVNLSLAGESLYSSRAACDAGQPALADAVALLRSVGIATVAAAGNDGSSTSLPAPACLTGVISVGASCSRADAGFCINGTDAPAGFSNTPPWLDLLAPGTEITSSIPGNGYAALSGTSMAAPHVAGALTLLRQQEPTATVEQLLAKLRSGSVGLMPITGFGSEPMREVR